MKQVLFVCVENAGRSQMAEAFAKYHGRGRIVSSSAGVKVAERVNPMAVQVMREKGIDMSAHRPKLLTPEMVKEADRVITMGCSVEGVCPVPLVGNPIDWDLEDPKGKPIEKVREIRDQIKKKVIELLAEMGVKD